MKEFLFLSQEWIHEAARTAQAARQTDENFAELTSGFSLSLLYVITELPQELKTYYNSHHVAIFVQLEKGMVRELEVGIGIPEDKIDFTVTTRYGVAKQLYLAKTDPGTLFVNRELSVEPMSRVYEDPKFSANCIVIANRMLKLTRQVPTVFVPEE